MQETKMTTNAMIHWVTLVISVALIIWGNCSFSLLQSGPPQGKTLEEYFLKQMKNKSESVKAKLLPQQVALAQRILEIEREKLSQDSRYVHLPNLDAYAKKATIKMLEEKAGTSFESLHLVEVKDIYGVTFVDTREDEVCYALKPVAEAFQRANAAYHKRTKGQLKPDACYRSLKRQLMSKTIAVLKCTKDANPSDKDLRKCMKQTDGEVAGPFTSDHRIGTGIDVGNWKAAQDELAAESFTFGCDSDIGRKDKEHTSWNRKKGGLGNKILCKIGL